MLDRTRWRARGIAALFSIAALSTAVPPVHAQRGMHTESARMLPIEHAIHPELATNSEQSVGIVIGFGIDVSSSIDADEFTAQLEALADTIARPDFRESIFAVGGPGSAAIFIGDFGVHSQIMLPAIDFRENNPEKFTEVANIIRNLPRRAEEQDTRHYIFLENAIQMLETLKSHWPSDNQHIAIFTDGSGYAPKNSNFQEILATQYGASISSFVTSTGSSSNYDWALKHMTTPSGQYQGPNGQNVPGGITEEIATESDTQGGNIARYRDRMFMAVRRLITTQTASINQLIFPGAKTRYASLDEQSAQSKFEPAAPI